MLLRKIRVMERERAVVSRNGRFPSILRPGAYHFLAVPQIRVEFYRLDALVFESKWAAVFRARYPRIVANHFTVIETNQTEMAMIYLDGELRRMLLPANCVLIWKDVKAVSVERIDIIDQPEPSTLLESLQDSPASGDCGEYLDWSVEIPQKW